MPRERSRYEILAKIASGGMATVYAGRVRGAVGFSRLVALKRPHPFVTEDAGLKLQLEAEARVASMIHHPNVVSVLDVEEVEGELVLVLDYVEGCTLQTLTDSVPAGDASFDRAVVRIILDVAAGLHAAHRLRDATGALLGVVHRDVSPQNVLVGVDGSARLTDFGIAKILSSDADPTAADVIKGKTAYLAPEYLTLQRFEARSDLFSLAVVTWEALARQRLFKGATAVETLGNILGGSIPLLSAARPELRAFDDLLGGALAREPGDRPASVEDFAAALERIARGLDAVATHAEVGAVVERVAGASLAARRLVLESGVARSLGDIGSAYEPLHGRDHVQTSSLPAAPVVTPADSLASASVMSAARRPRSTVALVALGALVAVVSAATMNLVRRVPEGESRAAADVREIASVPAAATTSPPAPATADPPAQSVVAAAGAMDAGAVATSPRRPRGPRSPARGAGSALLPAHAPPNPYSP